MSTKTATKVKAITGWRGDAALYRLDPPLGACGWEDEPTDGHEYVVVSSVNAMFSGPETFIFPAHPDGNVTDFAELDGSYQGGLDHEAALNGAGYEVTA